MKSESSIQIIFTGGIALALAMGIGRFAFTPMSPLMVRDGIINASDGAIWAAANYLGYFIGAISTSWFASNPRKLLILGQIGVVITTLLIAFTPTFGVAVGAILRGITGICSAWIMVCATSWSFSVLAKHHKLKLGSWIYTGVGLGIAITGLITWLGGRQPSTRLWIELTIIAAISSVFTIAKMNNVPTIHLAQNINSTHRHVSKQQQNLLIICYGSFGFGYIIPATYLPTMAKALISDPMIFGLTWPVFGIAAAISVAVTAHWLSSWPRHRLWAIAQGAMAIGTFFPLVQRSITVLIISAVLVGGTFMITTMAGFQMAREMEPENPTPLLSKMTASFAMGQILGPIFISLYGIQSIFSINALSTASAISTILLSITAIILWQFSKTTQRVSI